MITIKKDKSNRIYNSEEALFVTFPFSMERVAKIKSLPLRFYNPKEKSWEVPVEDYRQLLDVFEADEIDSHVVLNDSNSNTPKEENESHMPVKIEDIDYEFKTKPFNHQLESFVYADTHDKFLLGDEQGLGKTKQAIDIAIDKKHKNGFKHCLIICGVNSLKWNWKKEIGIHSNESVRVLGERTYKNGKPKEGTLKDRLEDLENGMDEFFIIVNIESLRKPKQKKKVGRKFHKIELTETKKTQLAIMNELEKQSGNGDIDFVIFDEIHKAKNAQSQQGKAIHHLQPSFKLALTGTPLMNKPEDLYNILKWLEVEKYSFYSFRNRYCEMGGYGGYEVVGYKNLKELQGKLDSVMLRRKKDEVLDLPDKIRSVDYVEMSAKQRQIYSEVLRGVKENITEIKLSNNPLSELIRLRQATAHTSILSDKVNESAKMDRAYELVRELVDSGQKAVIFSNWTEVTDRAYEVFKEFNPAVVTGKSKNREQEVERFQNDDKCNVIIGTIPAMGTGLTLNKASTVIFLDKPWNRANTEQAEDRAHRIGTEGTVNVITLVCKGTIDERIEDIIYEKGELSDALVEMDDNMLKKHDQSKLIDDLIF